MNLAALPDLRAADNPLRPAVADDNIDLNNTQFLGAVQRAAAALRSDEVLVGDLVAIRLPNTASFVVGLFRVRMAREHSAHQRSDVVHFVRGRCELSNGDAAAKVLIAQTVPEFDAGAPAVVTTDVLDGGQPTAEILDAPQHPDSALALLIYTSGTTGRPKGVMLDHANLNAMCGAVIDGFMMTPDDHSLLILPLFHVNGIVVGTLSPLLTGGRATIAGRFKVDTFFDRIEQTRATYFSAVPTISRCSPGPA